MRVLLAFDKFKDSLTAPEAGAIAADVLRERHPDWIVDLCPLTDGGEGFCEILTLAAGGTLDAMNVTGPRGELTRAPVGFVEVGKIPPSARALLALKPSDRRIAVIEMAAASGLALLPDSQRDPWKTSSLGSGELLRYAAEQGAAAILLGVGGSATHDLGLGALHALGVECLSAQGDVILPPVPEAWNTVSRLRGRVGNDFPSIRIACDVSNPLLGPLGAATIYAPQKGLKPEDLAQLEAETGRIARLLLAHGEQNEALLTTPGTGAAGGIAFGLMTTAKAHIVAGFPLVSAWIDLEARLQRADLVLTGEGRFDPSSFHGKGPGAIVNRARELRKAVHVFAGSTAAAGPADASWLHAITPPETPLPEALRGASRALAHAIQQVF